MIKKAPLVIFISLTSCLGGSVGSSQPVPIPTAEVDCAPKSSDFCNALESDSTIYVGLTSHLNYDCRTVLQEGDTVTLASIFDAYVIGTVTHVGDGLLQAHLTDWRDRSGLTITSLPNFQYIACAFIDTSNRNNRFDVSFEPYAQIDISSLSEGIHISSWSD